MIIVLTKSANRFFKKYLELRLFCAICIHPLSRSVFIMQLKEFINLISFRHRHGHTRAHIHRHHARTHSRTHSRTQHAHIGDASSSDVVMRTDPTAKPKIELMIQVLKASRLTILLFSKK